MKKILIFITCLFLMGVAKAQDSLSFSLNEAIQYALDNNYTLKNSATDIKIAKKKIWETTAIGLPQVSIDAQYLNVFKDPMAEFPSTTLYIDNNIPADAVVTSEAISEGLSIKSEEGPRIPFPIGVKENITANLVVSQLIFSSDYIVGLQASKTFKLVSEQSLVKSELEIKQLVNDSYHLVLVLSESRNIVNEILANIRQTEMEITEMFTAGFMEETDVDQIKLTRTTLENSATTLDRQIEVSYQLLKFQMGMDLSSNIILTENLDFLISSIDAESLLVQQFILGENIDFQLISTQEKLNELSLELEKWRWLPTLAGFYQHQEKTNKPEFDFMSPDMIGVNLQLPLFTTGSRISKIKQARLNLEKIRTTKEQVTQGLVLDFTQSRNDFMNALESYTRQKQNVELSKRIYDRTLIKYREGFVSSLELQTANNQYLEAQQNYFQDMLQMLSAKTKLNKILNTL